MAAPHADDDALDQAADALTEPARYAVAIFYQGELMCVLGGVFASLEAAQRKRGDKARQFPHHQVRIYQRDVTWTEAA